MNSIVVGEMAGNRKLCVILVAEVVKMANQHPKYGQPDWNSRRDNSYGKRQWRQRKVRQNRMNYCTSGRYFHGEFRLGGFYRGRDGRYRFFTYNKSFVRRNCNRSVRRYKGEINRPGMYRLIQNYFNEVV